MVRDPCVLFLEMLIISSFPLAALGEINNRVCSITLWQVLVLKHYVLFSFYFSDNYFVFSSLNCNPAAVGSVFLIQVILCWQKNANAEVVQSISHWQKWNLPQHFSKKCIFPNIQLKDVINTLHSIKNFKHHITYLQWILHCQDTVDLN